MEGGSTQAKAAKINGLGVVASASGGFAVLGIGIRIVDWIARLQTVQQLQPYVPFLVSGPALIVELILCVCLLIYTTSLQDAAARDEAPRIVLPYGMKHPPVRKRSNWKLFAGCVCLGALLIAVGLSSFLHFKPLPVAPDKPVVAYIPTPGAPYAPMTITPKIPMAHRPEKDTQQKQEPQPPLQQPSRPAPDSVPNQRSPQPVPSSSIPTAYENVIRVDDRLKVLQGRLQNAVWNADVKFAEPYKHFGKQGPMPSYYDDGLAQELADTEVAAIKEYEGMSSQIQGARDAAFAVIRMTPNEAERDSRLFADADQAARTRTPYVDIKARKPFGQHFQKVLQYFDQLKTGVGDHPQN